MSFLNKVWSLMTGRNGFNRKKHNTEISKLRDETIINWTRLGDKLDEIRVEFQRVEEDLKAQKKTC